MLQVMTAKLPAEVVRKIRADAKADDRTPSYVIWKILIEHYSARKAK